MNPMPMLLDTMVPQATTVLAITPAFVGVLVALVATLSVAIAAMLRELDPPRKSTRVPSRPVAGTAARRVAA